jgi:quercetin dioxygenase-like cupin family protein
MNEEQFRQRAQEQGYGDFQVKDYAPDRDGPLHTHEFSVMLLVVEGQFALGFEDGSITSYRPGEVCELAANVMHTERAGPTGAKVLLAKRGPRAPTTAA